MTSRTLSLVNTVPVTDAQQQQEEISVKAMVGQVMQHIDSSSDSSDDNEEYLGYETDDSWNVTRRRLAAKHAPPVQPQSQRKTVNRDTAMANLSSIPWPGDSSSSTDNADQEDDDEVARMNLQSTQYLNKIHQLSQAYTVRHSSTRNQPRSRRRTENTVDKSPRSAWQVSPDSVLCAPQSPRVSDRMTVVNSMLARHLARASRRKVTASMASPQPQSPSANRLADMHDHQARFRDTLRLAELEIGD